jgi:hypothetical protein
LRTKFANVNDPLKCYYFWQTLLPPHPHPKEKRNCPQCCKNLLLCILLCFESKLNIFLPCQLCYGRNLCMGWVFTLIFGKKIYCNGILKFVKSFITLSSHKDGRILLKRGTLHDSEEGYYIFLYQQSPSSLL